MASGNVGFNFGDLLGRAWEIFKNNAGVFVGAVLGSTKRRRCIMAIVKTV